MLQCPSVPSPSVRQEEGCTDGDDRSGQPERPDGVDDVAEQLFEAPQFFSDGEYSFGTP